VVPAREVKKVVVLGSGPKIIGQGAECDYAAFEAVRTLADLGLEVVVVQSDPATLATDSLAGVCAYLEPLTPEAVEKVLARERPGALLTTVGGATAQAVALALARGGVCRKYDTALIGATREAIETAEDAERLRALLCEAGAEAPNGQVVGDVRAGVAAAERLGFPVVVRAAFSLGGAGGSVVYNREEAAARVEAALEASPLRKAVVEEFLSGWREAEVELLRDAGGATVCVAVVPQADPAGVHAGDSVALVSPAALDEATRNAALGAGAKVGERLEVAGALGVRLALGPEGEIKVLGLTPRCSRTTAFLARVGGLPLGEFSARLALGKRLEEVLGRLPRGGQPLFLPPEGHHACRLPRFSFKRFYRAEPGLGVVMKSVGDATALGGSLPEAIQKAARGLEVGRDGLGFDGKDFLFGVPRDDPELTHCLTVPLDRRLFYLQVAFSRGWTGQRVASLTGVAPELLGAVERIVATARRLEEAAKAGGGSVSEDLLREAKSEGFSDAQIAWLTGLPSETIEDLRRKGVIAPNFRSVPGTSGRVVFATYAAEGNIEPLEGPKVLVLGGGPSRIGQGIELDYCCAQACMAARQMGYKVILVNPSSEAVATDGAIAERVYLEPLTLEDVLAIWDFERPEGVLAQVGGQAATELAVRLAERGVAVLGTDPETMRRALDRHGLKEIAARLGLRVPPSTVAMSLEEARERAGEIGYPVVVRPSRALGGPTVDVVYDEEQLRAFLAEVRWLSPPPDVGPTHIEKYLEHAIEVEADAVADGKQCVIGGVMEHVEEAGVHSGDSACSLPSVTVTGRLLEEVREQSRALALGLRVRGFLNAQFAIRDDDVYLLGLELRASRTVPFVGKATGVALAAAGAQVAMGRSLAELGLGEIAEGPFVAVKQPVFPFRRFPGADAVLGPEMKSTGAAMGVDTSFGLAYAKSCLACGQALPLHGTVFVSVRDRDKREMVFIAKKLEDLGFDLAATQGTATVLERNGLRVQKLQKVSVGRPNVLDLMKNQQVKVVINTVSGKNPRKDEVYIRNQAIANNIPLISSISAAAAFANGIEALWKSGLGVRPVAELTARAALSR